MLNHPYSIFSFKIKSYQSDQNGKLTLYSLFHLLQECAWDNARLNNFGYEYLESKNAFWVLSRVKVEMKEYPEWKDEIEIKTWPKGTDGFFAIRDFQIFKNGKVIGNATSYWLILDKDSKRPKRLDDFNFIHENFLSESAIDKKLERISIGGNISKLEKRKVYTSDLDVNKHVNNATYVRWILDSYFSKGQNSILEFEINFTSELLLNDEFVVHKGEGGESNSFILKNIQDKEICKAVIK
jgi:medium-chain acyl-[acyl-carrier-protein] hydrolase